MNRLTLSIIIGIISGILILIYDIMGSIDDKKVNSLTSVNMNKFSIAQLGCVLFQNNIKRKKAILAEIFNLARSGNIKFISTISQGLLGKEAEIKVEILDDQNLSEEQKAIIKGFKKHNYLTSFFKDSELCENIIEKIENNLKKEELISKANIQIRKRIIIFSFVFFFIPAIGVGTYSILKFQPILIGFTIFLIIAGIGRILKTRTIPVLSKKGLGLKQKIEIFLDKKKEELEEEIEENPEAAIDIFFEDLPFLILHKEFNKSLIKKFKKQFSHLKDFAKPDWMELDISNLEKNLETLDIIEIIDYTLSSTIFMISSASMINKSKKE